MRPVIVFFDGKDNWLADGFHRYHAHRKIGALTIDADVRDGTRRDAVLHSVGANAAHGLRRTNEDKRRAVETLIGDEEWAAWSDNAIAKACGVSHTFVATVRRPEVAEQRQENRDKSAAKRLLGVVSDTTPPPAQHHEIADGTINRLEIKSVECADDEPANDSFDGEYSELDDLHQTLADMSSRLADVIRERDALRAVVEAGLERSTLSAAYSSSSAS